MLFSSISFLYYFLPIILILYFLSKDKYKNIILLLASLFFYFYGEPKYTVLMLVSAFSAYIHGILIDKFREKGYSKLFLISGLAVSLGILIVFKYMDFIIKNINYISHTNIKLLRLALPIGISFYTFQALSYIVDVYRSEAKVCRSFVDFATYVCLFPQLIAGPIVRYTTIEDELQNRIHSFEKFSYGVNRFVIGLGKKVILANNLGILVDIMSKSYDKSVLSYWMVAIFFTLQIYYDFSGYSDMAIGLGRMFGFDFLENFNYPYISKSIKEFWRRWHISLSSFFRDYVYIPLGGNRVSKFRWIFNLFVVWSLTGFWHGDSWNFILWGLYFAVILVVENLFLQNILYKLPTLLQHIYAKFLIIISFVIFNNENIKDLWISLYNMFNFRGLALYNDFSVYYLKSYGLLLTISIICATPILKNIIQKIKKERLGEKILSIINPIFNITLIIVVTAYLIDGSFNPFLYFRF
ncbi:MBOAT family protein [Intestinibacter bartlettii]|uniref:MBOAT family protein n=1 Tax=Intestinibacter bartlettii TaxID=261299 RepID=A0ABS6DTQ5_9FIRM|nr:MBOAT family protein [Intestinibacter bartlettii]